VDILGVSILSGAHLSLCKRIGNLLQEKGATDVCFLAGGFIPDEDVPELKRGGVREVFGVKSRVEEIIQFIRDQNSNSKKG